MAITGTDQLDIYNRALTRLGSRVLASLTENREPRRVMDTHWGNGAIVTYALERGDWNFALRSVQGAYNPSITPEFGYTYVFDKPDDFVRLSALSASENLKPPLTDGQYSDEGGYWLAYDDILYVRYVSNNASFGFNSSRWTETFREYLAARLAWLGSARLNNNNTTRQLAERDMKEALKTAKSADAMQDGVKFLPRGGWASSRSRGPMQR